MHEVNHLANKMYFNFCAYMHVWLDFARLVIVTLKMSYYYYVATQYLSTHQKSYKSSAYMSHASHVTGNKSNNYYQSSEYTYVSAAAGVYVH